MASNSLNSQAVSASPWTLTGICRCKDNQISDNLQKCSFFFSTRLLIRLNGSVFYFMLSHVFPMLLSQPAVSRIRGSEGVWQHHVRVDARAGLSSLSPSSIVWGARPRTVNRELSSGCGAGHVRSPRLTADCGKVVTTMSLECRPSAYGRLRG